MATFSDQAWDKSKTTRLDAGQYCRVCLIDLNPAGQPKIKANCKLPVRYTPGGPYIKGALRNAAGRIFGVQGASADKKRAAATRLVSLMGQAKITVASAALLRLAGRKAK